MPQKGRFFGLSATMGACVVATLLPWFQTGCVPPRDDATKLTCTTNAQCPADGKHFCDTATNTCQPCSGNTCPGASSSSSSSSSSSGGDASTSSGSSSSGSSSTSGSSSSGADSTTASDTGAADATSADGGTCKEDEPGVTTCKCLCTSDSPKPGAPTTCYCDKSCVQYGDCCDDALKYCGWENPKSDATSSTDAGAPSDTAAADTATTADSGATDTTGPGGESCAGWCGKETPPPGSKTLCLCYDKCVAANACCSDYQALCAASSSDAGSSTDTISSADATTPANDATQTSK